jgi:hypothetical protein
MARYRIAWLPSDGIKTEVLEAAEVVLDKPGLDAEYRIGEIGWEFRRKEGDALPPRPMELCAFRSPRVSLLNGTPHCRAARVHLSHRERVAFSCSDGCSPLPPITKCDPLSPADTRTAPAAGEGSQIYFTAF